MKVQEAPLSLAVVIPATDSPPTLDRCLAALRAGSSVPDEIVVVDDAPAAGPAAARNLGASRSSADVLVFVDSDVEVGPGAVERIERRLREDPELAAVFGAYDDTPAAPGLVSRYRNLLHHHTHASAAGEAETFWAGLGGVRRESFEAVGGFDAERFPRPSVEDIDLGMRMRRGGDRIALDPGIAGTHLKAWTLASMVSTDVRDRGVPWTLMLLADGADSTALNLGWRQRAAALATLVLTLALVRRHGRLALAASATAATLDRSLYGLLARRGGVRLLAAGFVLQQIHRLAAVASVPIAVVLHLRGGGRR
jgi:hypothetical protein